MQQVIVHNADRTSWPGARQLVRKHHVRVLHRDLQQATTQVVDLINRCTLLRLKRLLKVRLHIGTAENTVISQLGLG